MAVPPSDDCRGYAGCRRRPFGAFTPSTIDDRKVLFIVGGIGVAPVKAMLERLDRRHQPIVLYRASRHDDLVYVNELRAMARASAAS